MADKVARPRVEFNGKEIESKIDRLTEATREWKKELMAAEKAGDQIKVDKLKKSINDAETETKQLKREIFKVDNVIKDINGASFGNIKKAFIEQSRIMRGLRKDSAEYNAELAKQKLLKNAMANFNNDLASQQGLFKRAAQGFNNYFGIITAGLASLTGIGLTIRKAVDMANVREDMLGNVSALTGLVGEELAFLEEKAKQYSTTQTEEGVRITKSADDILNAFQLVGSAQPALLKDKEALASVTREILILSEAADMEMAPAVDAVTKAMNQYGATAKETSRFTNAMAAGAKEGAVPINQIGESIKIFGVNANDAKVPIEQSVALIEILGEKGGKVGSEAGNQLRNFFTILASGADKTNPEVVGLEKAMENLANQNLSTAEYVKIFGRENANSAKILIENRNYVEQMTDALTNTSQAYDQARLNTQDNAAALEQAKNKSREYAIELGERLQPAMTAVHISGSLILKVLLSLIDFFAKYGKAIVITTTAIAAYIITIKAVDLWTKLTTKSTYAYNLATRVLAVTKGVLTGKIKLATIAQYAWNLAQKLNPIGLIIGLLTAAAVAISLYAGKTKEATKRQYELNSTIKESNELLSNNKPIKDRMAVLNTLSKAQLESLKSNIEQQLKDEEEFNTKMLIERKRRLDEDQFITMANEALKRKNLSDEARKFYISEIEKRKKYLTQELDAEQNKHVASVDELNQYLKTVEKTIEDFGKNVKPGLTDEQIKEALEKEKALQEALLELRKKYGLVSQYELYQLELKELNSHLARKLLSDEEYAKAKQSIYDKYLKADPITESEEDFKIEDPEVSLESLRAEADLEYRNQLYAQSYDYQYELLQQQWERGEIGWQQYNDRLIELDDQLWRDKLSKVSGGLEKTAFMANVAADFQNLLQDSEIRAIERKVEKGVLTTEEGEAAKKEIMKKYADSEFAVKAGQIIASTGLAIINAYAQLGPIAGTIAAPILGTIGLFQLTNSNAEREHIKSLETGGYTGFDGQNDQVAGIVHKNEFVANAAATANPKVKGVLDIINLAQQNGTINTLDLPAAINNISITRGFATGGYTSAVSSPSPKATPAQNTNDTQSLEKAAWYIYEAAKIFELKKLIITAEAIKKITEAGVEYEIQKSTGARN